MRDSPHHWISPVQLKTRPISTDRQQHCSWTRHVVTTYTVHTHSKLNSTEATLSVRSLLWNCTSAMRLDLHRTGRSRCKDDNFLLTMVSQKRLTAGLTDTGGGRSSACLSAQPSITPLHSKSSAGWMYSSSRWAAITSTRMPLIKY